ncbi:actin-like ATPase domain-containing protein [Aureobasidium sp. EXF-12298]|nr:actin-like ATPase domain-containing protein [Aureobasidium sp. EXF-12298]KAI4766206.1 actin-like ATPase domain-containing protein [Aureobasidium sp. EXF-12344]KAI4783725.1 actin-like ATPase domain-containing protein [Aureobasidium sp. EXF-3400]
MAPSKGRDRLIVGIDFGTTFSGCAIAYSGDPEAADEIQVVKNWPGSNGITSDKVPSEIVYENTMPTSGIKRNWNGEAIDNNKFRWGLEIKPDETRLRCLKLRLDPKQRLPNYVSKEELCKELQRSGKTAEEAISDYLTEIYRRAKEALVKRFTQNMVSSTTIEVVLTVPAVWTDAAKDATLRAAQKAGMGPELYMISEPEAAAIYALKSMGQKQKLLKVGDNFIVCDAGGGTVDLISYEIRSLSPLRLEESAIGHGALCGGVFLNMRFKNLVESRMGTEAFKSLCERKPKCMNVALNDQSTYDANNFNIPFPGAPDNAAMGIDSGFFILSSAEVAEVFRPLINDIIGLVERQRIRLAAHDKTAKGVILVGGFGMSNFLFQSLKQRFADEDPPPTYTRTTEDPEPELEGPRFIVMQPENSWTAVVRGAVLSNLEDKLVLSRKARRHYGIKCHMSWDPALHSRSVRYLDPHTQEYRASNQMSWHVNVGQDMPTRSPITLPFFFTRDWEDGYPDSHTVSIMVSDNEIAPQEYNNLDISKLCTLDANLRKVPRRSFKKKTKNGKSYRQLNFEIGMQIDSGGLVFDLRVNDIVYGTVKANYE